MKSRDIGWLFALFGILSLILALWFYVNQILLDPKQASSTSKNLAIIFALAGIGGIAAEIVLLLKSRRSGGRK